MFQATNRIITTTGGWSDGHQGLSHAAMQHRNRDGRLLVSRFHCLDTLQKKKLCWLVDITINSKKYQKTKRITVSM